MLITAFVLNFEPKATYQSLNMRLVCNFTNIGPEFSKTFSISIIQTN